MSESKFTEGPWKANGNGVHKGTSCVAIAYDPNVARGVTDVTLANARLIAAAPDLLDMLTLALPYVESVAGRVDGSRKVLQAKKDAAGIRAAIAKAKGE